MIKLGMLVRASTEDELTRQLAFVGELGLDTVDIHIDAIPRSLEFLFQVKKQCLEAGLPIGYLGRLSGFPKEDEASRDLELESARADMDLAEFLGAQMVRVFARGCPVPEDEGEYEALFRSMVEDLRVLSDYAASKGATVALQNHDHHSWGNTADVCLRLLREVGRKNFTFIMDTGQWLGAVGGSPRGWRDINVELYRDYLERMAPYASGVRAKIYKIDRGWEEWLDYPRILKILQANDFNGNISIVFEGGAPPRNCFDRDECLRLAVKHLREVIALSYL